MPPELRLQGKKALVTGSDTGIGHEIALEFARQGADVVFHYVQDDAAVKTAVEEVQSLGRSPRHFKRILMRWTRSRLWPIEPVSFSAE
jgi:NAD(P)-dependent dehydrogenase (short-subunit alcohol dehydrogenase family)